VDLAMPRDRNRTFEPQIVRKGADPAGGFNKRIIALCTRGMTTGDIRACAARHETRQHTLSGVSGVGKPCPGLSVSPNLRAPLLDRHQANVRA
jgi:transposase-like protein